MIKFPKYLNRYPFFGVIDYINNRRQKNINFNGVYESDFKFIKLNNLT